MEIKKIFINSIWFGVIPKISTFINILLLPILTPFLTPDDYGLWGLISAYVAIALSIYSLGLHMHLDNSFYEYKSNFTKVWGRLLFILLTSAAIFSIVLAVFIFLLLKQISFPLRILAAIFASFPVLFNANVLLANHLYVLKSKPKPLVLRNLLSSLTGVLVLFISVYVFDLGYLGFVFGAATTAVFSFLLFIYPLWIEEDIYPRVERNMIRLKINLKQSLPVIPHALGFILISSSSRIILDWYDVSISDIGLFSNGYMMGDYITILTTAVVVSIVPKMQEFYRSKQFSEYRKYYYFSQGVSLFAIILFSIWMPEIYQLLIRNEELQPAHLIAQKICFSNIVLPLYFFMSNSPFIEKKAIQLLWLVFLPGLINIFLCILLIPIYGYEVAIYTTIIAYWSLLLVPFISSYYKLKVGLWLGSPMKIIVLFLLFLFCFIISNLISSLAIDKKFIFSVILLIIFFLFLKKFLKNK